MVIGWDNFCRTCGAVVARGRELCRNCANSNGKAIRGSRLVALSLILVASLLLINITAQSCTRESVIWLLQSGTYGPISWDTPSVVDWYYAKICEHQELKKNDLTIVPKPQNRTEIYPINSTHELAIVFQFNKNIYNITRLIQKDIPIISPYNNSIYSETNLCGPVFISAFKYSTHAHEAAFNSTFNSNYKVYTTTGWFGTLNLTTVKDYRDWERYWTRIYTRYLQLCGAITGEELERVEANLRR